MVTYVDRLIGETRVRRLGITRTSPQRTRGVTVSIPERIGGAYPGHGGKPHRRKPLFICNNKPHSEGEERDAGAIDYSERPICPPSPMSFIRLLVAFAAAATLTRFTFAAEATAALKSPDRTIESSHSENGFALYVSNERSGDITIIDGQTNTVLKTIPAGKRPRGIHTGPHTGNIYVTLSGSPRLGPGADPERAKSLVADKSADGIAIIDPVKGAVIRMIKVGSDPEQFAIDPAEERLIVTNEDAAQASVWSIADGRALASFAVSDEPEGVALLPGTSEAYITCEEQGEVFVLDLAGGAVLARLQVGARPRSVAFLPERARAYVTSEGSASVAVIDTSTRKLAGHVAIPGPAILPMSAMASRNGTTVYVTTGRGNTVAVIDPTSNTVVAQIPVGGRPWGIALSPDQTRLFTANGTTNDISVVDTATRREVRRIKVGDGPWGIAIGAAVKLN